MKFNSPSDGQGIVQDTYFEAGANATSYPIADLVRNSNTALDNVATFAIGADKTWQFDSTNATDLPIGTTRLRAAQQDYEFDDEFLVVKSVECSDSTGTRWVKLIPIDNYNEPCALSDFATEDGVPRYYDKIGGSILLYPAPNYSVGPEDEEDEEEGGLRTYFQRKVDYFVAGDTTKEPGFAKHLHKYIPLYNAYVYACAKELKKEASLKKRLFFYEGNELEGGDEPGAISKFYAYREQDTVAVITSESVNSV